VLGDHRLNLLLHTLARVAVAVELRPTLQILLESLRKLVPFEAGGILVCETQRPVVRVQATLGYPLDLEMPATDGIVGEVLRTGQPRLVRDVRHDPTYVAVRASTASQLTVPLTSPRGTIGAISLESDRRAAFDDDDRALVSLFAPQAAILIERALMHEQLIRQSRLDRDLEIAREILQGLTPREAPVLPGLRAFGKSIPADTVGGDAYDFILHADGALGVSISDASGKGLPAALLALAHHSMLRALVDVELPLRAAFQRINELLTRSVPSGHFVTSFCGIVDPGAGQLHYVNAGHTPPLLVRANGTVEALAPTAAALGFPAAAPAGDICIPFGAGDGLVLFTDGVTDVGPSPDEFLDVAGVRGALERLWPLDVEAICLGLLDEVSRRAGGTKPDDATVVVLKRD
jgi:sigma-B regulation protein RsbU (phosphoserine phosphatase)